MACEYPCTWHICEAKNQFIKCRPTPRWEVSLATTCIVILCLLLSCKPLWKIIWLYTCPVSNSFLMKGVNFCDAHKHNLLSLEYGISFFLFYDLKFHCMCLYFNQLVKSKISLIKSCIVV